MNTDIDKSELLRRLDAEFARFQSFLAGRSAEQVTAPILPGGWSIKDIVAHFIAHEQRALQELAYARRGERLQIDHSAGDRFNQQAVAFYRPQPVDAVLRAWEDSYRQVVSAVDALSDADFELSSPVVRALDDSIDGALGNNTYEHYGEHLREIEMILKKNTTDD